MILLGVAAVSAGALNVAPAAQTAISNRPDTRFKLATFDAGGKVRVGLVLGSHILNIAGANAHLVQRAKVARVAIPGEMRELIEQYGTASPRLYQIANYFKTAPTAGLAFALDVDKVSIKAPIKYPWNLFAAAANYKAHAEGMAGETPAAAPDRGGAPAARADGQGASAHSGR